MFFRFFRVVKMSAESNKKKNQNFTLKMSGYNTKTIKIG